MNGLVIGEVRSGGFCGGLQGGGEWRFDGCDCEVEVVDEVK